MMKANLLTTTSALALAAFIGTQLPSTHLGQAIGHELGVPQAAAQAALPVDTEENEVEMADADDHDDHEDDDHNDEEDDEDVDESEEDDDD